MTKRIVGIFLLAALTLSVGTLATAACKSNVSDGGDGGPSPSTEPTKLLSPEILILILSCCLKLLIC